jgi:hypothetical protein
MFGARPVGADPALDGGRTGAFRSAMAPEIADGLARSVSASHVPGVVATDRQRAGERAVRSGLTAAPAGGALVRAFSFQIAGEGELERGTIRAVAGVADFAAAETLARVDAKAARPAGEALSFVAFDPLTRRRPVLARRAVGWRRGTIVVDFARRTERRSRAADTSDARRRRACGPAVITRHAFEVERRAVRRRLARLHVAPRRGAASTPRITIPGDGVGVARRVVGTAVAAPLVALLAGARIEHASTGAVRSAASGRAAGIRASSR